MFNNKSGTYVSLKDMGSKVFTNFLEGTDIKKDDDIRELIAKHENLVYKNLATNELYYHISLCEAIIKEDSAKYEPVPVTLPPVPEEKPKRSVPVWAASILRVDDTPTYTILRVREQYVEKKKAELKERHPDMEEIYSCCVGQYFLPCPVREFVEHVADKIVVTDKTFTLVEDYTEGNLCSDYLMRSKMI